MKIIIEWFLLDNALMNACIFLLASALSGVRIRTLPLLLFSLGGAVYALLALFYVPLLRQTWVKVLSFLLLALPLHERGTSLLWQLGAVLLAAVTVGGTVLLITLLTGGTVHQSGTIVGTLPLRTSLTALFAALLLPRIVRAILKRKRMRALHTVLTVRRGDQMLELRALIDTGNLLTEPISGLPVILIAGFEPKTERIVPYVTQGGQGFLPCERLSDARLSEYGDVKIECYAAKAMQPIPQADAILPAALLPAEGRKRYETMDQGAASARSRLAQTALGALEAVFRRQKHGMVHPHGRSASAAARSRGGSKVHRTCSRGEVGEGQTDRS